MQAVVTQYKNLTRWDVKNFLLSKNITKHHVCLSSFLHRKQNPWNGTENIPMLSLHFGGDFNKRENNQIKGKLFVADSGDLTYSKIDLRNGAIGIIPHQYAHALFTTEFPIYEIDTNVIHPVYLQLYLQSDNFKQLINSVVSGSSGRKRVKPSDFENLFVFLPSLTIQKEIVEKWHEAQNEVQSLRAEVKGKGNEIENYILCELGISRNVSQKKKGIFVVRFMELERWDTYFNSQQRLINILSDGKYQISTLKSLCNYLDYGLMPLQDYAKNVEDGIPYIRVTNITKDGNLDLSDMKYIPKKVRFDEGDEVREDDILLVQAGATTGKSTLIPKKVEGYLAASFMFVIRLKKDIAYPKYIFTVLQSSIFTNQVRANLLLNKSTRLYITKPIAENLKVPLPPMAKQIKIADRVDEMRIEISKMKNKTKNILENTKQEIDKMLKQ